MMINCDDLCNRNKTIINQACVGLLGGFSVLFSNIIEF